MTETSSNGVSFRCVQSSTVGECAPSAKSFKTMELRICREGKPVGEKVVDRGVAVP
jgi:hypothetical protein